MCSQGDSNERKNFHDFQYTKEWLTSDEPWDTDDDNSYFSFGTSISSPKLRRAKSKQLNTSGVYSMEDKVKASLALEGELQAERYSIMVADDTLEHLRGTIRSASSMVDKGTAINDELARQERILSKAENNIAIANYETDQTIETLKGMKSLRCKLARALWKKKPKERINDFMKETRTFINLDSNLLDEDVGLSAFNKMNSGKVSSLSKDIYGDMKVTQQMQIKAGIEQLHKALDTVKVQQMNTASALDQQERLSVFENQISTTNQKIKRQSKLIGTIIGK